MEHDAFHVSYLSDKIPEAVFHGQAVKTVAYLRVSTAQQDVGSQRLAILEYARKHDFRIDDFIEATASGQASETRRRLDELMHVLQRGDRLVVSELSPFGRSLGPSLDRQAPSRADTLTPVRPIRSLTAGQAYAALRLATLCAPVSAPALPSGWTSPRSYAP